jgi:hypothetical protein
MADRNNGPPKPVRPGTIFDMEPPTANQRAKGALDEAGQRAWAPALRDALSLFTEGVVLPPPLDYLALFDDAFGADEQERSAATAAKAGAAEPYAYEQMLDKGFDLIREGKIHLRTPPKRQYELILDRLGKRPGARGFSRDNFDRNVKKALHEGKFSRPRLVDSD